MIHIQNLSKSYNGKAVFNDLNMDIVENDYTSLCGDSGIGKTTLLRIIAGLEKYDKGTITGLEGKRISYVFQEDRLFPWLNVMDNILLVMEHTVENMRYISLKEQREYNKEQVRKILSMLQLRNVEKLMPSELSGGMKRRVSIARALAYDSDILLLDEAFKGLQDSLKWTVINNIKEYLSGKPRTVICATHNIEIAYEMTYNLKL